MLNVSLQPKINYLRKDTQEKVMIFAPNLHRQILKKIFKEPSDYNTQESQLVVAELSDPMEVMDIDGSEKTENLIKVNMNKDTPIETELKKFKFQKEKSEHKRRIEKNRIEEIDLKHHHLVGEYKLKYKSKSDGTCQNNVFTIFSGIY